MKKFEYMDRDRNLKIYWEGKENQIIRIWVYIQRGLQEVNEFKYLALGLFSIVAGLYLKIPLKLVILAGAIILPTAVIGLTILGRWQLKKAAKVEQWVSTEYGSVLRYNEYNIQVETLNTLKKILKKLDEKTDNTTKEKETR